MAERAYNLNGVSVHVAIPVSRDFPAKTVISLLNTTRGLDSKGVPHEIKMEVGGSIIERSRNFCLDNFLKSEMSHLFWIDSDVTWSADDFIRILALGTVKECVLGMYPAKVEPTTFFLSGGSAMIDSHGCIQIHGTGIGFCCVQRQLVEKLAEKAQKIKSYGRDWPVARVFRCDVNEDGQFRGEDHAFFADIREMGHSVWLDPAVKIGHVGDKEYTGDVYQMLERYRVNAA